MIKPEFKVIIAGGRTFNNYQLLKAACDRCLITKRIYYTIIIVSGKQVSADAFGNKWGADYLGEQYAEENGFEVYPMPALWKRFGKRAGMLRNFEMACYADALIAFWDGESPGTKNMIECMKAREKLTAVIHYTNKL